MANFDLGDLPSAAAVTKSVFSIMIMAIRSKTLPGTWLTGERGRAVASSEATAAVLVEVFGTYEVVCAEATETMAATAAVRRNIFDPEAMVRSCRYYLLVSEKGSKVWAKLTHLTKCWNCHTWTIFGGATDHPING